MSDHNKNQSNAILKDPVDFSLVLGGFLYQCLRRAHLSGDALQLLTRRIIVLTAIAWVPLLLLSLAQGHALPGDVQLPFLHDIELHVRLLIAMPILIAAELIVHKRMRPIINAFFERQLIPSESMPKFTAAVMLMMEPLSVVTTLPAGVATMRSQFQSVALKATPGPLVCTAPKPE